MDEEAHPLPERQLPQAKPGWWLAGERAQVLHMKPFPFSELVRDRDSSCTARIETRDGVEPVAQE